MNDKTETWSLIKESLPKERQEFLLTPIFQHRSEESSQSIQNDDDFNGYKRKVIDRIVTPVPFNVCDTDGNDSGDIEVCIEEYYHKENNSLSPLLRRVAVRSYLGHIEERQVGVVHATFSLPINELPRNVISEMIQNENTTIEGRSHSEESKNWLCWTQFLTGDNVKHNIGSHIGKSYLCVLAGPRTLKIFDVYPKGVHNNDNVDEISQGEGQTISLPFDASSIFALPSPYYGLLLQRADNGDDEVIARNVIDEYYPIVSNNMKGDNTEEQKYSDEAMSKSQINDDIIIQGPPSTVRLGLNNNNLSRSIGEGVNAAMSPSSSSCSSEIGMGIPPSSPPVQNVPSLYTLHNPLLDILPCNVSPCTINGDFNKRRKQSVWRTNYQDDDNIMIQYFANVFEQVIFVGKPRSFKSFISTDDQDNYEVTILVTYNTKFKRHAIWTLKNAITPKFNSPLWQQTSNSFNNSNLNVGVDTNPVNEYVDDEVNAENDVIMSENNIDSDSNEETNQLCSPFSDLHARVSLNCIYVTSNIIDSQGKSIVDHQEKVARRVFLATNSNESGDFVLCLLQKRHTESSLPTSSDGNDHNLRFLSLKLTENNKMTTNNIKDPNINGKDWDVSHTYDMSCISAQPVYSTPLSPPSFSPLEDNDECFLAKWRQNDISAPAMALDICVCRKDVNGTKLCLFREMQHIADCAIHTSQGSLTMYTSVIIADVQHSVGDRIDVICVENNSTVSYRVAVSLIMNDSSITERALLTISSSIMHISTYGGLFVSLCHPFRVDCAILSQMTAKLTIAQENIDDLDWYIFSSLISTFFAFALNKSAALEAISSLWSNADSDEHSEIDGNEAWENLLSTDFHTHYIDVNSFLSGGAISQDTTKTSFTNELHQLLLGSSCLHWLCNEPQITNSIALKICSTLFDSLHLLFEEMKLSNSSGSSLNARLLGKLLHDLCSRSCYTNEANQLTSLMGDFVETYNHNMGMNQYESRKEYFQNIHLPNRLTSFQYPPCFLSLLERAIKGENMSNIIRAWMNSNDRVVFSGTYPTIVVLFHFFCIYFDKKWIESGESGMVARDRYLIMAMTRTGFDCPSKFLETFPLSIATLFMEVCYRCRSNPPPISNAWSASAYALVGRTDLSQIQDNLSSTKDQIAPPKDCPLVTRSLPENDIDKDGLVNMEKFSAMYFPNDTRIREAAKLLRSSRPTFLRVQRSVEVSDHDYERQKQEKLALLCRRIVSLPLGRSMLTFGTLDPIPAEPLSIPQLCLSGRIPPRNATIALESSLWTPEMKVWPEFHNGVAAGLRLPQCIDKNAKSMGEIERSWIVYNKPSKTSQDDSQTNSAHHQSQQPSRHAHGGFLMALGLRGYLTALSMPDVIDYLTKGSVTIAVGVLLGMSANKRGTCDLSVSKMLCLHIPSLFPTSFSSIDVASESQIAAVTGIGLLYQKSSHRLMTEFLLNEIGKRPTNEQNIHDRESYSLSCGIALGMVNLCLRNKEIPTNVSVVDDLSDLQIEERLLRYIVGGLDENHLHHQKGASSISSSAPGVESERCSRIHEGDMVNIDVTAPGAILALGMIYLKSGNLTIAKQLALPETSFGLDKVRPDFLFLSVVARSLVLWEQVEASPDWIEEQIPKFVRDFFIRLRKKINGDTEVEKCKSNVDTKAMKEAHAFIVSGACFSLGLRFAGTSNELARDSVFAKVVELQKYRDDSDPTSMRLRPQRPIIEMCIGSAAMALAMIMAGTGDLKTLRLLKMLRWRCDEGVKYGGHMAINAAVGLLFLGGGACTLGQEPEDIAALLAAFYPRFPSSVQDNQYHLQALRHLYALAVKQRSIEAVDVESGEKIFVPIQIEYADCSSIETTTPCLLMNRGRLNKIKVTCDRYYPVEVDLSVLTLSSQKFHLFVKKRSGSISYVEDPYGLRSNFFQSVGSYSKNSLMDLLAFTADAKDLQVYARYLCGMKIGRDEESNSRLGSFLDSSHILLESLLKEKTDSVNLQLALHDAMNSIGRKPFPIKIVWDMRLLRTMYENKNYLKDAVEIVSPNFIAELCHRIDNFFSQVDIFSCDPQNNLNDNFRWVGPRSVWLVDSRQNS